MNNTCDRCGEHIEQSYHIHGVPGNYGSTCVYIVAKANGVKYDVKKYGVGAFDADVIRKAIRLATLPNWKEYEARQEVKRLLGSHGWRIVFHTARTGKQPYAHMSEAGMIVYKIVQDILKS